MQRYVPSINSFPICSAQLFGVMHPSQNSSFSLQLCKSIASICQWCVPRVQYQCVALRLRQHLSCDQAYCSLSARLRHYLGIWGIVMCVPGSGFKLFRYKSQKQVLEYSLVVHNIHTGPLFLRNGLVNCSAATTTRAGKTSK